MSSLASYRILRSLGGGTFGKVKRNFYSVAKHMITSALVAIKVLNKSEIRSKNLTVKVKREIEILSSFHHPNIVRLYDVIESSTSILIVMEFLPGGELYNLIEQCKLTEDQAKVYFLQVLDGLEYIHKQGFAHRDIKPENLLIDQNGKLKIGDFGLSNYLRSGEFLKTQCGSPNYAAPELISGAKYCGSEVDVWSLGVVLYALMARELPFDHTSMPALFSLIKSGQYKAQHHFSDSLNDLVQRMLTVNPISRINIAQIKNHPWLKSHPLYASSVLTSERVLKTYKNEEIQKKVIRQVLQYEEFRNLSADYEILDQQGKVLEKSKNFGNDFSATYEILLDIELQSCVKTIEKCESGKKPGFSERPISGFSEITTASNSYVDESCEINDPNNWVYGFRSNLPFCYLAVRLFETFKDLNLRWRLKSKSRMQLRGENLKISVIFYKFEDVQVIDCTLKHGPTMIFFEILHHVYKNIYNFTHLT